MAGQGRATSAQIPATSVEASVDGKRYEVLRCDELVGGVWTAVADVTAGGAKTQVPDPGGAT